MTEDTSLREKALRATLRAELRKWPDNAEISIDGLYVITAGELAGILDASDQLDRMRERAKRAEAALRPFSEAAQNAKVSGQPPFYFCDARDYENARAILTKKQDTSHD